MDVVLSGRYQLVTPLGQGGMGEVWKGVDTMLNRPVAVKLIRLGANPSGSGYEEAVKRFRREAQAVAALNHPNIVTAYDFGLDPEANTPYLVMELIDGISLSAELNERDTDQLGALPLDRVFMIAADVLAGLGAAHAAGVIHRDLKPANLMTVARTNRVKIVDFGIARGSDLSKLTRTGGFVGTVAYMAPELMTTRGKVTSRADLYSFGCVMYELLTGGPAFDAAEPAQFIAAHMHTPPIPLRELLPGAPEPLEALLLELLAKKPEDRPADAEEVAERLAEFAPAPAQRPRRVRKPAATLVEDAPVIDDAEPEPSAAASTRALPVEVVAPEPAPKVPAARTPVEAEPAPKVPVARTPVEDAEPVKRRGDDVGTRAEPVPTPVRRMERSDAEPVPPTSRNGLYTLVGIIAAIVVGAIVWLVVSSGGNPPADKGSGIAPTPLASAGASGHPSASPSGSAAGTPLSVVSMPVPAKCAAPAQLSLNRNGTLLAGAGPIDSSATTTEACLWNVASRGQPTEISRYGKVYSVSFAANNPSALLIMSNQSTPINLIDTGAPGNTKNSMASAVNWPAQPEAVAFAPDGATLAVSDRQTDTVKTFYIQGQHGIKDTLTGITKGPGGGYGSLAYSPDGKLLVRGEPGGFVVFATSGTKVATVAAASPGGPMPAAFAGNGHVVTCHGDELEYWDIQAAQAPKYTAKLSGGTCAALSVSADGKTFAVTMTSGANASVNVGSLPTAWK